MKDRFFTKLDWAAFWTATMVTFIVYFLTLGPSVGLEDSGELATAAAHLGVPHPPGYPFWTFCSWLFCKIFAFVTYMGHPTPAWCVSLFSAVTGAFASGVTAMLICRSSSDFMASPEGVTSLNVRCLAFGGGVAGALTFALSPVEWSQSTIVEIYSLNALFLMWIFLLSYRWMRKPSDRILWLTAYIFGLGLTNYQVLVFAIVPLALVILMRSTSLFRDVFIYLLPAALTYQLLQIGALDQASAYMQANVIAKHNLIVKTAMAPNSTLIAVGVAVLTISIFVAGILQRRQRHGAAIRSLAFGGGAAILALLSASTIFASAAEWTGVRTVCAPLIEPWRYGIIATIIAGSVFAAAMATLTGNQTNPKERTINKSWLIGAAVLGGIAILLALAVPQAGLLGYQGEAYPWSKSTLVFITLIAILFLVCKLVPAGMCFAIPVAALHICAFVLLRHGALNGLTNPNCWYFWWPLAWNVVLLALVTLTLPHGVSVAGAAFFTQLGVAFYAYMPIVSDLRNPPMNWGYPRTWEGFKHAIQRGQYEAIGFQIPKFGVILNYFEDVRVQFTDLLIPFAIVPFAAGHWLVGKHNRRSFWQWMLPAFVCFLLMSFLLIALANVKGDLQDGFIQKVKFISSHAMLALWIGYGLVLSAVFALAYWEKRLKAGAAKLSWVAIGLTVLMIAVSFSYPLIDNYCGNYRLGVNEVAFKLGASEQNGHTFGWQFGAYQLNGAKAIKEQLIADEEPLPDPEWPEAMEPFSIFFGGTDPGRFVPTYMIYAANFRPDVYLITQNALADDTYMSVERDLYGDEIWIPSKEDSAESFNIYVDEVKSGKRKANGDIKIENGRVQVTGALGVMEINGILSQKMFEHDRLRHNFYVEESYVIPWMYKYLSPHGLIMKINRDPKPYDPALAAKDRDFWDWYTRRLLSDSAFRRDFAAQKSFSKLRAALAGLYINQRRWTEAAQAYREACLLYPASPEATFRYIQEFLMPYQRWDQILELLDYTDTIDPNNRRTEGLREYTMTIGENFKIITKLEPIFRAGNITPNDQLRLGIAYAETGRSKDSIDLLNKVLIQTDDPALIRPIAMIFIRLEANAQAELALTKYLRKVPERDVEAWMELAKLQFKSGRTEDALISYRFALRLNRAFVHNQLGADETLRRLAALLQQGR